MNRRIYFSVAHGGEERSVAVDDLPWNEHKTFAGVFLRHLVKGSDSNGAFSCHLVKIAPGCGIGNHEHADSWELHQVVAGNGAAIVGGTTVSYASGVWHAIPHGAAHRVDAGENGLELVAYFSPPLL